MARHYSLPPWSFVDFSLAFKDPRLRAFHEFWRGKCKAGRLPARADFDPRELREHLGRIFILELTATGDDFVYRLVGTEIVDAVDADATGQRVGDVMGTRIRDLELFIAAERLPVRHEGYVFWREKAYKNFETVLLPLADDGVRVDRLLGQMVFGELAPQSRSERLSGH